MSQLAIIVLLDVDLSIESPDGIAANIKEDLADANYNIIQVHPWKRDTQLGAVASAVPGFLPPGTTAPPSNGPGIL